MKRPRLKLVVDTNVLIDLHWGDVLNEFFALPYEFFSPDVIISEELKSPDGEELLNLGLQSYEMDAEGVQEVYNLAEKHRNIAVNDLFAFVAAKKEGFLLLTGDERLRKLAEGNGVTVHGTLWVLDQMIEIEILNRKKAIWALCAMLEKGSRLPKEECKKRLRNWKR
jgi:predicted nucleic acid-binding protein